MKKFIMFVACIMIMTSSGFAAPVLVETFDGTDLNPLLWNGDGNAQVQNGKLVWDIPANGTTTGGIGSGIGSVFTLSGDIDIRVDFNFEIWPANSGIHVASLALYDNYEWMINAQRFWDWGRQSDIGVINGTISNEIPASNTSGKYRITEIDNIVTAYAWDFNTESWKTLISGSTSAHEELNMGIGFWGGPFSAPIKLTFDNLTIETGTIVSESSAVPEPISIILLGISMVTILFKKI
ncbi:MAG: PEP-CTERM sorting domain-containing protein [Candidatus Auribacterota bacterium]